MEKLDKASDWVDITGQAALCALSLNHWFSARPSSGRARPCLVLPLLRQRQPRAKRPLPSSALHLRLRSKKI